jgi:hypothetical protein
VQCSCGSFVGEPFGLCGMTKTFCGNGRAASDLHRGQSKVTVVVHFSDVSSFGLELEHQCFPCASILKL